MLRSRPAGRSGPHRPSLTRALYASLLVGLVVGIMAATAAVAQGQPTWRTLEAVLAALERNYLWEVDVDALLDGAVQGAVAALDDPFTTYAPASGAALLEENRSGRFGGLGATFAKVAGEPALVLLVYEGLPAHAAGLRAGDRVHSVDALDVTELTLDETVALIRGPAGDPLTLGITRGEESLVLSATRALLDVPVVTAAVLPGDVGYIAVTTFENRQVLTQLRSRLAELEARAVRGLILDLRGNGGGYLAQGVAVADEFLAGGHIAFTRAHGVTRVAATADPHAVDLPLVVLIDEDSASASEIVAAALQDHGRALVVGRKSFGKGVGQDLLPLPNGAELKYVTFEWLRPSRENVHEVGVTPDIIVAAEAEPVELSGTGFPPHAVVTVGYGDQTIELETDGEGRLVLGASPVVAGEPVRPGEARPDLLGDTTLLAAIEALETSSARARL